MSNAFSRTEMLLGPEAMRRLAECRVAVFGIGGVGGYTVEALARSGIGALDLTDNDTVCLTNLNRQILALHSTLGQYKTDVAERRIHDINPDCRVTVHRIFFLPDTEDRFDFSQYDYVVDAIDTVTGKLALARKAGEAGVPIISAMGTGNKTDPAALRIGDISETSVCPLARVMRSECRKRGIERLKVVYSTEPPVKPAAKACAEGNAPGENTVRRDIPGSTSFVPAAAGLIIAGEVVRYLCRKYTEPGTQETGWGKE